MIGGRDRGMPTPDADIWNERKFGKMGFGSNIVLLFSACVVPTKQRKKAMSSIIVAACAWQREIKVTAEDPLNPWLEGFHYLIGLSEEPQLNGSVVVRARGLETAANSDDESAAARCLVYVLASSAVEEARLLSVRVSCLQRIPRRFTSGVRGQKELKNDVGLSVTLGWPIVSAPAFLSGMPAEGVARALGMVPLHREQGEQASQASGGAGSGTGVELPSAREQTRATSERVPSRIVVVSDEEGQANRGEQEESSAAEEEAGSQGDVTADEGESSEDEGESIEYEGASSEGECSEEEQEERRSPAYQPTSPTYQPTIPAYQQEERRETAERLVQLGTQLRVHYATFRTGQCQEDSSRHPAEQADVDMEAETEVEQADVDMEAETEVEPDSSIPSGQEVEASVGETEVEPASRVPPGQEIAAPVGATEVNSSGPPRQEVPDRVGELLDQLLLEPQAARLSLRGRQRLSSAASTVPASVAAVGPGEAGTSAAAPVAAAGQEENGTCAPVTPPIGEPGNPLSSIPVAAFERPAFAQQMMCAICHEVPLSPHILPCTHAGCLLCFEKLTPLSRKCPECREFFFREPRLSHKDQGLVADETVTCLEGCFWKGPVKALEHHLRSECVARAVKRKEVENKKLRQELTETTSKLREATARLLTQAELLTKNEEHASKVQAWVTKIKQDFTQIASVLEADAREAPSEAAAEPCSKVRRLE